MPITIQHTMEFLSYSYVCAVAAKAGVTVAKYNLDYGIDVTLSEVQILPNGKPQPSGWSLHLQLKASTATRVRDDEVIYDMDVDAYNKLAYQNGPPCFLVLMRLPKDSDIWLSLSEEELLLKSCCYWKHIDGPPSDNSSSITIGIPRDQQFNPNSIGQLFSLVKTEDWR